MCSYTPDININISFTAARRTRKCKIPCGKSLFSAAHATQQPLCVSAWAARWILVFYLAAQQ